MLPRVRYLGIMAFAGIAAGANWADAANCALRNPDRQIYEIFPSATSYRSVVSSVDEADKRRIEARLGSAVSFNDLGKHTVYVVLEDAVPIGFVHARSEIGKHGSVELVWALDLDLKIRDFRVQRSREKHTKLIRHPNFRNKLKGKDVRAIRRLLANHNSTVDTAHLQVSSKAEAIAHIAVLCGAKTIIITGVAFSESVFKARLLGNVHRFFPQTAKVNRIRTPLSSKALATVQETTGYPIRELDQHSLTMLRSVDVNGRTLGFVAFSMWPRGSSDGEVWWAVAPTGVVKAVVALGVEDETASRFSELGEKALDEALILAQQSTAREAIGTSEVLAVMRAHGIVD